MLFVGHNVYSQTAGTLFQNKKWPDLHPGEKTTTEAFRITTIQPGYYDVNSLATEVATALTQNSIVHNAYTCVYGTALGRYEINNA